MKFNLLVCLPVISMLLVGCATNKQWMAVGGSRADGTVKLAFEYGEFERPILDEYQGHRLALRKCKVWGYSGTEPFGSTMTECIAHNNLGCLRWRVFAEYQCTTNEKDEPITTIEPIKPRSDDTPLDSESNMEPKKNDEATKPGIKVDKPTIKQKANPPEMIYVE